MYCRSTLSNIGQEKLQTGETWLPPTMKLISHSSKGSRFLKVLLASYLCFLLCALFCLGFVETENQGNIFCGNKAHNLVLSFASDIKEDQEIQFAICFCYFLCKNQVTFTLRNFCLLCFVIISFKFYFIWI